MKFSDKKAFENDFRDYRPVPFWSWNNELDPAELVRQIEAMKAVGIGGFIMHARTGLKTEYLSEKWFECVRVCLDKAKELDMNAWMYDENGWPSGFCGGKLLEDERNRARWLERKVGAFDPAARAVFVRDGKKFRRTERECGAEEYHNVYVRVSPTNTDILDPVVVERFLESTYEQYRARFSDRFGKEFVGFFTDEPQYFRYATPYTPVADAEYEKEYGERIDDGLISLFERGEEHWPFRLRYYRLLNRLYTLNYYKRLYDWCDRNGLLLTGHTVEETYLFSQMWGSAASMPSYEYEHIPGIDYLCAFALEGRGHDSPLSARQVGSAAAQCGKRQVLTETFGCSGWDCEPRELRYLAELQYVGGVNLLCPHLMNYSLQSNGKLDYPPSFSEHENWWERDYKEFCDYFGRLGYLLANTEEDCRTLIVHPEHNIYLDYLRSDGEREYPAEKKFDRLLSELEDLGIRYHFADEWMLSRLGSVEGKNLRVGKCVYDAVILAEFPNTDGATKALLERYAAAGGTIVAAGRLPEYCDGVRSPLGVKPTMGLEALARRQYVRVEAEGRVRHALRRAEDGELLYVVSLSEKENAVRVPAGFREISVSDFADTGAGNAVVLPPRGSAIFVRERGAEENEAPVPRKKSVFSDATASFRLSSITANNLTLDCFAAAREGEDYGAVKYCYLWKDELIRSDYRGALRAKYTFEAAAPMPLRLLFEKGRWTSVALNGKALSPVQSAFDVNFLEADLTGAVRAGTNEIEFGIYYYQSPRVRYSLYDPQATESVRNCLVYDTEVESVYVSGDFVLDENRRILPRPTAAPKCSRLDLQGYPMFSGRATFAGEAEFPGGKCEIRIAGRYMTASVRVDGKEIGRAVLSDRVAADVPAGRHAVEIEIASSLRNKFGPHHFRNENEGVSPWAFTLLGQWKKDGTCEDFDPDYRFVPFGIDRVTVCR